MGCLLFKESKLNFLENLKTEGYINSRRELTFEKDIHKYLNNLVDRLNLNYDLDLKTLVTIKEVKIKTGKDFSRDSEKFILTPIEESFEQIDNRRKELGIYEDRISIGEYNKTQGEKISNQEGINVNLYSQYLEQNPSGSVEQFKSWVDGRKSQDFYQIKNIFNSALELQNALKAENKTANSLGSEKNIDKVLKKAGLDSEMRKQFLQLLKDHPTLKSLKLSEVINSYLKEFVKESDKQYYKAIDEPLSKELENILIDYFDKFYIEREELDNLKEKFGVDSVGVFDVLAKTIYYAKNRNLLTLPEEYGHVFVELLGSISNKKADNPLFKYMFDNIESWDGYQRVYRDYKDKYLTSEGNIDIYKIKKEAIGQAIGIALVRNYRNNKVANKSLWDKLFNKNTDFWIKVQEIIDYLYSLLGNVDYVNINLEADKIAKDILAKNYSKLDRLKKDTSNYNLLSYSETIKNQNQKDGGKALKFMQWFSNRGMLITGSLAYRLLGTTYRPEIDSLHDIDNIVPSDIHKVKLQKLDYLTPEQLEQDRLYRKAITEGNYREARKHKVTGNLRLNVDEIVNSVEVLNDFKKEFPDTKFLYSFFNQKANAYYITINAIWSEDQSLKDRFASYSGSFNQRLQNFTEEELSKIYLFDFFLRPETSEQYNIKKDGEFGLTLAHYNYAFYEKLNMMGRPKDAYDYQNWQFFDEKDKIAPDFNDRLLYYQLNQSENKQPTQENNSFQQFQESLNKPNTNLIFQGNQEEQIQNNLQKIITDEKRPTQIDTTKSDELLWGELSSYEYDSTFKPNESQPQYSKNNSLQSRINGKDFKEIWNSNEFTSLERESILLHSIQERLLNKNSFNGKLFEKINTELGKLELRIIDNSKYPFLAFQKQIYINPKEFVSYLNSTSIENIDNYLDLAVSEELIHVLTNYITSFEDLKKIAFEIKPENFKYLQKVYKSLPSGDFEMGTREYLRMIVQQEVLNTTTEKIKYTKNGLIDELINKIWNFLYDIFKNNKGVLSENIKKHIDFINSTKSQFNTSKKLNNKQVFNKSVKAIIDKFSKMFPNIQSVVISEKEIPKEVRDKVEKLGKQINSFYHKGQVYIIKERVTKDIAIEEFLHPFINALEQDNPELYKSLLLEAKKLFPELKEKIFKEYQEVYDSTFDLNREFLTQALTQKVSELIPEQQSFFDRFKSWLKGILNKLFGNDVREISMLDENMTLEDLANILNENDTQFNFNPDLNTTYYSLSEKEIYGILNQLKGENTTQIQKDLTDIILNNNKVTEFIEEDHEYFRFNEFGERVQLKPVSSFLPVFKSDTEFEDFDTIGNVIHDIVHLINNETMSKERFIKEYSENSKLNDFLVKEKGYPVESVRQIISNLHDYISKLKNEDGSILLSEVAISHLQNINEDFKGIAGTLDLIEIKKDGSIVIHDFKSFFINATEKSEYNEKSKTIHKFNQKKSNYEKQLSLYKKLLIGLGINSSINLQIVPIPYLAALETKDGVVKPIFNPSAYSNSVFSESSNFIYNAIPLSNFSNSQKLYQITYQEKFASKILFSIPEPKKEKVLSQKEIDQKNLINNLTNKLKSTNSKGLELEIEKTFKQIVTVIKQYNNSQDELNRELYKIFDPNGELKETKNNFEVIFDTIKELNNDDPEKLKHYLYNIVQYINYIEETNIGLNNIKNNFYKIIANDANLSNAELISELRRSYLLAKSQQDRIKESLKQIDDIEENNLYKQMLKSTLANIEVIENLYFEKSLPLIASTLNSYFSQEMKDNAIKEVSERIKKHQYDLTQNISDKAKERINNEIIKLQKELELLPSENIIAKIIKGEFGDSDWFYSSLMANINNPDYVISGTEKMMTDIMQDLRMIAIRNQNDFWSVLKKREDILGVNRDQTKKMNEDLVYSTKKLILKDNNETEEQEIMTLITEVDENIWFDYEVLLNNLKNAKESEKESLAKKVKDFEKLNFESEFSAEYLKVLESIDVIVSDGRNVKNVRQAILDKIKYIQVKNNKLDYLQGELSEEDTLTLKEYWREYNNLFSELDRNGNKKTGADLEISEILQERKSQLDKFRTKKENKELWSKLRTRKIQSLLSIYSSEEQVLNSEEFKEWTSKNSTIKPSDEFYEQRQKILDNINTVLNNKKYKDINLVKELQDNLNNSWEKLLAISKEYRDFEREINVGEMSDKTKSQLIILEENINKIKIQIKNLEEKLSKEDAKTLKKLWEEYNSLVEYKNSKYYEEDFENALQLFALDNDLDINELRSSDSLMSKFRLNNEWFKNNHITKESTDALGNSYTYQEPAYYYKVIIPSNKDQIIETPANQYYTYELNENAYNLDENKQPNYLDNFGRKKVKKTSKYITENTRYLKLKNANSQKEKNDFETITFLKNKLDEYQKGLNKNNYIYYQIPSQLKSGFERISEKPKDYLKHVKEKFVINLQDEEDLGTRGVLANLSGEEARFIPVLYKSKIDIKDQTFDVFKAILGYGLSAEKAKMMESKLPLLDTLVDHLEKNLPAVEQNKFEVIGKSLSEKFNLTEVQEVIRSRSDKRLQAVNDTISRYVYEEFTKELANFMGISDIKLTNAVLGYAGKSMMFGNLPNWVVNAMSGNIQLMIESTGKRFFTKKDVLNAKIELIKKHKDALEDMQKGGNKSLFGQLVDYFDPVKGEFMDEFGQKFSWSKRTNLDKIFFFGKIYGEWEMQMTTFIAMLKAKKVKQILPDKSEKIIDLYDAFEKGENGIPKLKEGVQFSEKELKDYMTKIQGINKLLNGSYAKLDQTKIEKYSLGRMSIFMKKFFIPLMVNRFGKYRLDAELQDVREGHYRVFYNTIVKDIFNLNLKDIYAKLKKSPEEGGYTDLQKSAIYKTLIEFTAIALLSLSLALLGYDDDEEDSDSKKYAQYILLKLRREVAIFTPVAALQEFASFFSRPFAAMSSVGNLINLSGMILKYPINITTGAFEDDLYYQRKTALWDKGDSKFLALLYKSLGLKLNIKNPDQLLQGYNYFIRF